MSSTAVTNGSTAVGALFDHLLRAGQLLADAEDLGAAHIAQLRSHLNAPELARVTEILHLVTHELASTLALSAQELAMLQQRAKLRARHPLFNAEQCDALLTQGWSLALGQDLQRQLPGVGLRDIALAAQRLRADAASLPAAHQGA